MDAWVCFLALPFGGWASCLTSLCLFTCNVGTIGVSPGLHTVDTCKVLEWYQEKGALHDAVTVLTATLTLTVLRGHLCLPLNIRSLFSPMAKQILIGGIPLPSLLNLMVSVGSISAFDPDISQSKRCIFPPPEVGSGLVT